MKLMNASNNTTMDEPAYHAAQIPVIGVSGLEKLRSSRCHVSGTGRIGTAVIMNLLATGLPHISANDPQVVESENIGQFVFARIPDVGKPKVQVLERFLDGRSDFVFEPVVSVTESDAVDQYFMRADLIISCANSLRARLAAERKAIELHKPVMQVSAFDGREQLGGLVTIRLPENRWSACFGCYCDQTRKCPRGEGLLSTATATLAAVAANMAVELLTDTRAEFLKEHNCHFLNLESYCLVSLAVQRRTKCKTCGDRV